MTHSAVTRRAVLAGTGAAILARPHSGAAQTSGQAVLRVVSPWEYTSNDPADTGYILTRCNVAETLIGVRPDGTLVGQLVDRWDVDADRRTWRFNIRPGVLFHDGSPLTAEAAARSLRRGSVGESLSNVKLDAIEADGNTLVIRTKTPFAPLPAFLADYAAIVLAPACYGADGAITSILGTGPYRLTHVEGRTTLELERFDRYWGAKAQIARVRYTAVVNGDTRANIALAGDADLVFTLAPQAVPRINASGQAHVESLTIPRPRFITLNLGLPQFNDVRVRQAMSLGIDRVGIATGILRNPASAATQLLPPVLKEWYNPDLSPLRTDPAASRAMLDAAGWVEGQDGIRTKAGARLAATMLVPTNRPELTVMATAVQSQLRAIGLEITVEPIQSSSIPETVRNNTMQSTMIARTYVNVPDPIATVIPDYTLERSVWGTANWSDRDQMRALTNEYVESFDEARRAALRRDITKLIQDQMPVIPVSWFEHTVAVSSRIRDVVIDPFETNYYLSGVRWS